jgi:hypothetical protein
LLVQVDLEFKILLPQLPECWDYRYALPHPAKELDSDNNLNKLGSSFSHRASSKEHRFLYLLSLPLHLSLFPFLFKSKQIKTQRTRVSMSTKLNSFGWLHNEAGVILSVQCFPRSRQSLMSPVAVSFLRGKQ